MLPAVRAPAAHRRSRPVPGAATAAPPPSRSRPDWGLAGGLALIAAAAAVPRVVHLGAHLPALVAPDEPTVMDQAVALARGRGWPRRFDWPPLAAELLAGAMRATGRVGDYLFARRLFVAVALATVVATGVLAAALVAGAGRPARRAAAWTGAALLGVAYLSVRLSRQVHPEHLQMLLVLASFGCTLRYDRDGRRRWLAGAGVCAGLAGAAKYLGGLVVLPALVAAAGRRRRARSFALLAASAAAGFLAGAPSALARPGAFADGLAYQFGHQATTGHLGYDAAGGQWWFHLTRSLPGNWGWPATVLAVGGVVLGIARGSRAERLAATFVVPAFALIGASRVRFPHYVLLLAPFLAAAAGATVARLVGTVRPRRWARRAVPAAVVATLAVALAPTAVDDARLVRAAGAPDTREVATALLAARLPGVPAVTEQYGVLGGARLVPALGESPDVPACRCVVVVSSYQEERFRREPARYAKEVARYDALRARGRVVAVVAPRRPLPYDWDLLPRWGLRRVPLRGDTGPVGPTIWILDLRPPPPGSR
jgi:4-amino-4-deoxy-L-arabinose transferase-like glycosyltransferase